MKLARFLLTGSIGGNQYRFLLDTGAARSCITFDDYTSTFPSIEKSNSSGVFAKSSDDLITVPNIAVGPISKQNFTLARTAEKDPHIKNLIGMDLLKDLCCHFFFDENRVLVDYGRWLWNSTIRFKTCFLTARFHPYVDVQFGTSVAKAVWDTGARNNGCGHDLRKRTS